MDNEDEGARLTQREENRELIAKHRATVEPRGCPTPGACSCPGSIPDSIVERATVDTPRTDSATVKMERLDGDFDEVVSAAYARTLERELIDLKQRLLPQANGRAERAEHERDALLEQLIAARSSMQQAYGCLWRYVGASNPMFLQARKMLLARLTKEQQASGIRYANELFGPTTEHEILHSGCSHDAAPSATRAPDRPDWAQQLPGAEIFDRSNDAEERPE